MKKDRMKLIRHVNLKNCGVRGFYDVMHNVDNAHNVDGDYNLRYSMQGRMKEDAKKETASQTIL